MSTFYDFMMDRYLGRKNRFGDLASDMEMDDTFPKETRDKETIRHYLICCGACFDCLRTFESAWRSYRRNIVRNTRQMIMG